MSLVLAAKKNDLIIIDGKPLEILEFGVHVTATVKFNGGPPAVIDKDLPAQLDDQIAVKLSPQQPAMSSVKLVFEAPKNILILRQKASAKKHP